MIWNLGGQGFDAQKSEFKNGFRPDFAQILPRFENPFSLRGSRLPRIPRFYTIWNNIIKKSKENI